MTSLNPVLTIGKQMREPLKLHLRCDTKTANETAANLLTMVGMPDAKQRLKSYPHELSGGMRQRVMIAIALACSPQLLIADEPTTALDVTMQAQIIDIVQNLRDQLGTAMIWITHDLGVIAGLADRVLVMYGGRDRRAGQGRRRLPAPRASVHAGPARLGPTPRPEGLASSRASRGQPPNMYSRADRVHLRPAVPVRVRPLLRRSAPARRGRRGPHGRMLVGHRRRERLAMSDTSEITAPTSRPRRRPAEVLVSVRGVKKHFPIMKGVFRRQVGRRPGRRRRHVRHLPRRDARARRRERLGQVDRRSGRAPARDADRGHGALRRHRSHRALAVADAQDATADADGLPEPALVAQPADDGGVDHRRAARRARRRQQAGAQGPHRRPARPWSASTRATPTAIRTSSRVVSASASASHGRSRSTPTSSSATSRSPRSTCRSRPRSSTCSRTSRTSSGLTYLFISHDLSMVRHIADRVAVMYLGRIVELAPVDRPLRPPHAPVHESTALGRSGARSRRREHTRTCDPRRRHSESGQPAAAAVRSTPGAPPCENAARPTCPNSVNSSPDIGSPAISPTSLDGDTRW